MKQENEPVVNIDSLRVCFGGHPVVDGVSLAVGRGEFVAFVGESGCGKSLTAYAVGGLLPEAAEWSGGRVLAHGRNVREMSGRELRRLRGGTVAYIFQEPGQSLNPVMRVGDQLAEAIRLHRRGTPVRAEALRLLGLVGLPDAEAKLRAFPHELSGGMQQRIMIAMALACEPDLLIADEPTTALDVTIQAQVIELLQRLNRETGMAVWLITHNLALARDVAQRIFVMYAGGIVEEGPAAEILARPLHPYTRKLLASAPVLSGESARLEGIRGSVPSPENWPEGCRFHPRCDEVMDVCRRERPVAADFGGGRHCACHARQP